MDKLSSNNSIAKKLSEKLNSESIKSVILSSDTKNSKKIKKLPVSKIKTKILDEDVTILKPVSNTSVLRSRKRAISNNVDEDDFKTKSLDYLANNYSLQENIFDDKLQCNSITKKVRINKNKNIDSKINSNKVNKANLTSNNIKNDAINELTNKPSNKSKKLNDTSNEKFSNKKVLKTRNNENKSSIKNNNNEISRISNIKSKDKYINEKNDKIHSTLKNVNLSAKLNSKIKEVKKSIINKPKAESLNNESSSDSEDGWEEVEEIQTEAIIPEDGIQVTVENVLSKKQKKKLSEEEEEKERIRCLINRIRINNAKASHKIHLMCLLCVGFHRNNIFCNDTLLQALCLSITPSKYVERSLTKWDDVFLKAYITWFNQTFKLDLENSNLDHSQKLTLKLKEIKVSFPNILINSRLHFVLICVAALRSLGLYVRLIYSLKPISFKANNLIKKPVQDILAQKSKTSSKSVILKNPPMKKTLAKKNKKSSNEQDNNYSENDNDDDMETDEEDFIITKKRKASKLKKTSQRSNADGLETIKKKKLKINSEDRFTFCAEQSDYSWWIEVYLPKDKKWFYVNCVDNVVGGNKDAQQRTLHPFVYIVAYDNDNKVKDLSAKYDENWLTVTYKKYLDFHWWTNLLLPFKKPQSELETAEDILINDFLYNKPMPTSISDFKNHPLYVIERHLLKFEAIYPSTALVYGKIRGENIYPRDCVHTLHAREKWLLKGRSIKLNEESYKIVKARPKWDPRSREFKSVENLRLFGKWQTEIYKAPPAIDGKIQKNEYGNIELFKPWMLPAGTVFLEEPLIGLNKIAKKLEIDIAAAMLGWEFHKNMTIPILRGWVVCVEHKDILLTAWQEEQKSIREKDREKREQRVLDNWKLMIRSLIIRERLKKRFHLEPKPQEETKLEPNETKEKDVTPSWPANFNLLNSDRFALDRTNQDVSLH